MTDTLEVMIFDDGSDVHNLFYGRCMEFSPEQKLMKALLEITAAKGMK